MFRFIQQVQPRQGVIPAGAKKGLGPIIVDNGASRGRIVSTPRASCERLNPCGKPWIAMCREVGLPPQRLLPVGIQPYHYTTLQNIFNYTPIGATEGV